MTEGEKRCGLGSFLPMSCRGRAEAFARRLHNRLRSLGSQDGDDTTENSWLANSEVPSSVTSLQPRHSATENDIFMDFGLFDTPGSPAEEIVEPELAKFITNPKDDLHHLNLDECGCVSGATTTTCHIVKRNSLDSDSSDGQYFDPENVEVEPQNCLQTNHVNGVSHSESRIEEDDDNASTISPQAEEFLPSDLPTSSESTASSLSHTISEEENLESALDEQLDKPVTSGWCLNYEPQKESSRNNNIYNAIDLESLKRYGSSSRSSQEEISIDEDISSGSKSESYCSHFNIQQDLTIECPNSENCLINPVVEVSTLEIHDTDECQEESQRSSLNIEVNGITEETSDSNLLQVQSLVDNENTDDNEDIEEERIPRVRRCSSLKTGKTPPGTPGRKKIVRFADVLGLDLADVRTFMDEIPKIPTSAYDDLSVDLSMSDTSICSNSSALDSVHTSSKTVVPMFQQPGGEASFMDKIRNNLVCLENAVLKDSVTLCISGTVRVRNFDFHKSVHIRYSLDGWKSFADLQATYIEGSCDGFSDKFSFTLYVHTLNIGQRLEFAVRFQCKGCQYWDNNEDKNYVFQCLPTCTNTSYVPITTPDDNNWAGAAFY